MVGVTWERMLEPSQDAGGGGIEPQYEDAGNLDIYVETDGSYGASGYGAEAQGYGSGSCTGGPEPYR